MKIWMKFCKSEDIKERERMRECMRDFCVKGKKWTTRWEREMTQDLVKHGRDRWGEAGS